MGKLTRTPETEGLRRRLPPAAGRAVEVPGGAPYPENQDSVDQRPAGRRTGAEKPGGAPNPENRRFVDQAYWLQRGG